MQLPQEPTEIPPVRRYSRSFGADRGHVYRENDTIKIQIPPIDKTYLTKNVKLHFDFDLKYNEMTAFNALEILTAIKGVNGNDTNAGLEMAKGFFGYTKTGQSDPGVGIFVQQSKPFPTLDINGPYGLFSKIQVHDYLGTTLLEDVQAHDVFTATMTEFMLEDQNMDYLRPVIPGTQVIRKPQCSLPFNSFEDFLQFTQNPYNVTFTNLTTPDISVSPVSIPTVHFSINLFSFLGLLSDKFVPLHNGFTISFTLNKNSVPIKFSNSFHQKRSTDPDTNNVYGLCVPINAYNGSAAASSNPTGPSEISTDVLMQPSLVDVSYSNFYLKADLLELSQELDQSVDKIVHARGYKYQLDFIPQASKDGPIDYTRRLLPSLKSLRRVLIGQRPRLVPAYQTTKQQLGFRIRNYITNSSLLYNKSKVSDFQNSTESYDTLKSAYGPITDNLDFGSYTLDELYEEDANQSFSLNTSSQRQYLDAIQAYDITGVNASYGSYWWQEKFATVINSPPFLYFGQDVPTLQGKNLLVFDCVIPGSKPNSIAGIDTSSNVTEYNLKSSSLNVQEVDVDVFMEHDMFIHVNPGKSTAVSF